MAVESKRGCGYRKVGGLYMMSGGMGVPCCKMPLALTVCPCCGEGIKQSRGWTWIDAGKMFKAGGCQAAPIQMAACPLVNPALMGKVGLLWVGEKFYKTPREFMAEGYKMGISRRLTAIPRDYKQGETWVMLAHPKAVALPRKVVSFGADQFGILDPLTENEEVGLFASKSDAADIAAARDLRDPLFGPGVFYVFKPNGFELIVKQSDYDRVLAAVKVREFSKADPLPWEPETDELKALLASYDKDVKRGVTWVPVPDDDKDHAGTVYDKAEEEVS